ncbi:MAG: hypothetical protein IJS15_01870 [Victivallales bacterium]|nr:hypothetical protein [Victivallales bacterium]
MIKSFADKNAEAIFNGKCVKRMAQDLQKAIRRKLKYLRQFQNSHLNALRYVRIDFENVFRCMIIQLNPFSSSLRNISLRISR